MIFGTHMSWRLLSPLTALLWVTVALGVAAPAHADDATGANVVPDATSHATPALPDHASDTAGAAVSRSDSGPAPSPTTSGGTSGDITQPQPISTADANTGGANGQCPNGPYCSTRDGSASGNGSGGGLATGEPCAGCVGKADNKNPAGQMPNATDGNAGYECDTNHGIAKSNPAHTGCSTPQQECVPTETVPCVPTPPCVPTATVPCVPTPPCVPTATVPCVSAPACVPTEAVPCVSSNTVVEAPVLGAPNPSTRVSTPSRVLPNTGSPANLPWLAATALAIILTGVALVSARRRPLGS